jgi:hypothetical protein
MDNKMMLDELTGIEMPYVEYVPSYMVVDAHGYAHAISDSRAYAMRRQLELGLRAKTKIVRM